jgi:hypothetical protein
MCGPILGIYKSLMNVEIGTEAGQFPEKEYINGIFLAVCGGGGGVKISLQYKQFHKICRVKTTKIALLNEGFKQMVFLKYAYYAVLHVRGYLLKGEGLYGIILHL